MQKKSQIILLILLLFAMFIVNYRFLDSALEGFLISEERVVVERIIDGDTIVVNESSVRLLGINSPERGEDYYAEAKEFLENLILNKSVELEFGQEKDKYGRGLAYVFLNGENVNVEMVEKGFANYYFYSGREKYSRELVDAWETCIANEKNLCEKSVDVCAGCIFVEGKSIVNDCDFDCDVSGWKIHGEGRKYFVFSGVIFSGEEIGFDLDLSNSGGSLFLRDEEGNLILWEEN